MASIQYFSLTVKLLWNSLRLLANGDADATDVERWANLTTTAITSLETIMATSTLSTSEKQRCQASMTHLLSIKRKLDENLVHMKRGGGLKQDLSEKAAVSWDDIQSAFERRIKSGVITNLKHLGVLSFMTDARALFEMKIKLMLKEHDALKVNTVLAAEYALIKDDVESTEIKYFNTGNGSIYQTTDLKEWFIKKPATD